jgi:hypothetical protein
MPSHHSAETGGYSRPGDALSGDHRSDRCYPGLPGAADFDLELIETRTLDRNMEELIYRTTLHS